MEKIFKHLTNLMQTRRLYTNPTLTRKQVADTLSTNEAYLHRAIKKYTGLTFSGYLFSLRLEHACQELASPDAETTIETIAHEAGYRSRKTFHQHFRQHYKCTPAQYRRRQGAGAGFPCGQEDEDSKIKNEE